MLNALSHSRPPSYKSHVSDHPVIETGPPQITQPLSNNAPIPAAPAVGPVSTANNQSRPSTEQIQVAQVHAVPGSNPGSAQVPQVAHEVVASHQHQRSNSSISQQQASISQNCGQDVSIVQVPSSNHSFKTDLQYHYDNSESGTVVEFCDTSPIYEQLFAKVISINLKIFQT